MLRTTSPTMSSGASTGSRLNAFWALVAVAASLTGCARPPENRVVSVNWQALLVYHPLWEAQMPANASRTLPAMQPSPAVAAFSLPPTIFQPLQTPDTERRRQRMMQAAEQQRHALTIRLQQMEARLLREELAQLEAEQQSELDLARQEVLRQVEQEVEQALSQHEQPQAEAEIKRQVIQRLLRIRPDQRDALSAHLQQVEATQQQLSVQLQRRLAQIEQNAAVRLRERTESIQRQYDLRREQLLERSAKRLQAEQLRAILQTRAFADAEKMQTFPPVTHKVPADALRQMQQSPPVPVIRGEDLRFLVEQDVKQWVEAICRKHRWIPVWQAQTGIPDVTAQIAQEMRGNLP
jgi:hypothetical protein